MTTTATRRKTQQKQLGKQRIIVVVTIACLFLLFLCLTGRHCLPKATPAPYYIQTRARHAGGLLFYLYSTTGSISLCWIVVRGREMKISFIGSIIRKTRMCRFLLCSTCPPQNRSVLPPISYVWYIYICYDDCSGRVINSFSMRERKTCLP